MGFPEIGFILRFVFVYRLNIKRMNSVSKKFEDRETMRNFWTGVAAVIATLAYGVIQYNVL